MNKRAMTVDGSLPLPCIHGPCMFRTKDHGVAPIHTAADRIEPVTVPVRRN
jgi:hypothetical protein